MFMEIKKNWFPRKLHFLIKLKIQLGSVGCKNWPRAEEKHINYSDSYPCLFHSWRYSVCQTLSAVELVPFRIYIHKW